MRFTTVLLPPPEDPTSANLRPGSTCRLRPFRTCTSRRLGYANLRAPQQLTDRQARLHACPHATASLRAELSLACTAP